MQFANILHPFRIVVTNAMILCEFLQKRQVKLLKARYRLFFIVIGKKINYSTPGSQIFTDLQPHFPRFVCILHTNLG